MFNTQKSDDRIGLVSPDPQNLRYRIGSVLKKWYRCIPNIQVVKCIALCLNNVCQSSIHTLLKYLLHSCMFVKSHFLEWTLADLDPGTQFQEMYEKQAPTNFILFSGKKKEMRKREVEGKKVI